MIKAIRVFIIIFLRWHSPRLVATMSSASFVERVTLAIFARVSCPARQFMDCLVPRVAVGVSLDVGCIAIGLAVLRPRAARASVVALHVGCATDFLHVIRVAGLVAAIVDA